LTMGEFLENTVFNTGHQQNIFYPVGNGSSQQAQLTNVNNPVFREDGYIVADLTAHVAQEQTTGSGNLQQALSGGNLRFLIEWIPSNPMAPETPPSKLKVAFRRHVYLSVVL